MKLKKYIYLLPALLIGACVSEFNAELPLADEDILVIEGDIIAHSDVDFILSKTFELDTEILPPDYNDIQANIVIVGSDGSKSEPATYMGKGVHRISVGELKDDVEYGVEINYAGNVYTSKPEKPLRSPEIDELSWEQSDKNGDVSVRVSTHSETTEPTYYLWDYVEDWEITSYHYVRFIYDPETEEVTEYDVAPYFYCWKNRKGQEILVATTEVSIENTIKNKELIRHNPQSDKMSLLYSIRVTQMAITKKSYEYYQNRLKMSEQTGGLFTPQPSELKGNISCVTDPSLKVIGYVNVAQNLTNSQLYINGGDISKTGLANSCKIYSSEEIAELQETSEIGELYLLGYYLVEMSLLDTTFSKADCTDCRLKGGSKTKPDFWPNDHK